MNRDRSFDIFRMGANGVDPDRGTARYDQTREARSNRPDDPPFDHGVHHHPEDWGQHAQRLDRSADYGYGSRDPRIDDRERYRAGSERGDAWRHGGDDMERGRYHQGMSRMSSRSGMEGASGASGMPGVSDMAGFPQSNYGNTGRNEPYPPSRSGRDVWRGRNEDYDFWGRERHPAQQEGGGHLQGRGPDHPSLWQRVKGAFSGKGPKNYVRSDDRIHEDVCEHLTHHPYIDASDIEVIVRDGEVTLSGYVDARLVKRAAEEACDAVRGVKDVHNHLRVRPQNP